MRSRKELIASMLAIALIVVSLVGPAMAQGTTSRVVGTVLDPNGAIIVEATVTLTNEATKVSFSTRTTSAGTYVFESVQSGYALVRP